MELLKSNLPDSAISESRDAYVRSVNTGVVDRNVQFAYAVDLLRTSSRGNHEKAITLLEDLFQKVSDDGFQRDCLYYLAIAYTRLSEYERAVECCDNILKVQPKNHQASELKTEILARVRRDGITGIAAIGGGVALGVAAILGIGLGIGLSKRK